MAIKVTLREKNILGDKISLYLDFYPAIINQRTGESTRREFLKLYIHKKPKNSIDKLHNKEALLIAEQIRQKRDNELNKPEIYSSYELEQLKLKEKGEQDFLEYIKLLAKKRTGSTYTNWYSTILHLEKFISNNQLRFNEINEHFLLGFKDYLLKTKILNSSKHYLSHNSAVSYFDKIKTALKQAYKDEYIQKDLSIKVSSITKEESNREYLTIDELNKLANTPCKNDLLKRAALFSALTGLRFSDIQKMVWKELEFIPNFGHVIKFSQKKTKANEFIPISEQAFLLLGETKEPNNIVFEGLEYSAYHNNILDTWIKTAGITKYIRFHSFRHSFATLQLYSGTDIYTVSKMLGHKDLKTTQIYAKIVDESKRIAANKIKLDF